MRVLPLAFAAAALAVAAVPAPAGAAVDAGSRVLLPVWASFDGDTPIGGARVFVEADGRPVPQSGGRTDRTEANGIALLEFDSLPRSFTVVVQGGRSEGRPVRGSLTADVRGYDAGDADIVYVNPVTTLIAAKDDRGYGPQAAARLVRRSLGLPAWLDTGADLQATDRWFGGDAFQDAAAKGIAPLVGRLTRRAAPRRVFRDPRARRAIAFAPVLAYLKDPALSLLKDFAIGKGQEITAKILSGLGLASEDLFDSGDIKEIRKRFDAVDRRLVELKELQQKALEGIQQNLYTSKVLPTIQPIADVKTAINKIDFLAETAQTNPKDAANAALTKRWLAFIRSKLDDGNVLKVLDIALGGRDAPPPRSSNILTEASRLTALRTRFFTDADSAAIRDVYDYYALVQAEAAFALAFSWYADSATYSQQTIDKELNAVVADVTDQEKRWVKPSVPASLVVDRETGLTWTRSPRVIDGKAFYLDYRTSSSLKVGSEGGFRLPTLAEWSRLVTRDGKPVDRNLPAWLAKNARIAGLQRDQWASDSAWGDPFGIFRDKYLQVSFFDLEDGKRFDYCQWGELAKCYKWYGETLTTRQLRWIERFREQAELVRPVKAGDYWWE